MYQYIELMCVVFATVVFTFQVIKPWKWHKTKQFKIIQEENRRIDEFRKEMKSKRMHLCISDYLEGKEEYSRKLYY